MLAGYGIWLPKVSKVRLGKKLRKDRNNVY